MSRWDVRVVRASNPHSDSGYWYSFREVIYSDDGSIAGWTADEVSPHGETAAAVRASLRNFQRAAWRPILTERVVDGREVLVDEGAELSQLDRWDGQR
jgi:hypothetical protein